ncbi:MAG: hypothetical protein EKE20_15730, partial [Candidatus Symbiopectobacterium sp. Dall1.0]|nr:hypothetical protein [Candidatus Symbiopectobacterium sp. Dall1.0]
PESGFRIYTTLTDSTGRRQAIHDYPYRDTPWIEDMGRSTRRISLRGFIVQSSQLYNAGDVFSQRDSLIAACETGEPGTLIHPTLGELIVSVPAGGLRISESLEQGRVFSFTLMAIESGDKQFSITEASTAASSVTESWASIISKTATTYIATVKGAMRTATQAIKTIKRTTECWTHSVTALSNEVTNLGNVLSSTFGSDRYGRYNSGTVGGNSSGTSALATSENDTRNYDGLVSAKMAEVVQNRAAISSAISRLLGSEDVDSVPENTQVVLTTIIKTVPSIYDLMRVFESLSETADRTIYGNSRDTAIQAATLNYLNIVCAGAMAFSASKYRPSSRDDAMAILSRVTRALDNAAVTAADHGYTQVYQELLVLRTSIIDAMRTAGASLADVKTVKLPRPLPALTISNQLYQDAARSGSLIKAANPIHPAFMPVTFKALSS